MNPWVALIGRGREGRSVQASKIADHLRGSGRSVGGFIHHRLGTEEDHRGHDIEDVRTRARWPLTRIEPEPDLCDYKFAAGIFDRCRAWTNDAPGDVTFVEMGRIECQKRGHWPTMLDLMAGPPTLVVTCLRPSLMAPIALALPDPVAYLELPATGPEVEAFTEEIIQNLSAGL